MYRPSVFAMEDLGSQHDLIEACDFGVLTGNGADGLFATHIPMLLKRDEGRFGVLYGHVAQPNPHAKLFGSEALAVFSGPHAYISPTWYSDRSSNVPTWNYSAVHCYGVPATVEGEPLEHLSQMVERYEGSRANGWRLDELKPQIRETLPRGIVTFRMEIARIEGKAKLSQNKPREERERVIAGLEAAGEAELVEAMRAALEKA
jgi:transcriptional regulator